MNDWEISALGGFQNLIGQDPEQYDLILKLTLPFLVSEGLFQTKLLYLESSDTFPIVQRPPCYTRLFDKLIFAFGYTILGLQTRVLTHILTITPLKKSMVSYTHFLVPPYCQILVVPIGESPIKPWRKQSILQCHYFIVTYLNRNCTWANWNYITAAGAKSGSS